MAHPAGAIQQRRGLSGAPTQTGGIHDVRTNKQWTCVMHYKRGYPRASSRGSHKSETTLRKQLGMNPRIKWRDCDTEEKRDAYRDQWRKDRHIYNFMQNWPRWWDIAMMIRPWRRRTREMVYLVQAGKLDPDDAAWPLYKKPHNYYW